MSLSLLLLKPVYPRWRGEHNDGLRTVIETVGLSPLARGTLTLKSLFHRFTRFIPAGAGNTVWWPMAINNRKVYPRWRGEHLA